MFILMSIYINTNVNMSKGWSLSSDLARVVRRHRSHLSRFDDVRADLECVIFRHPPCAGSAAIFAIHLAAAMGEIASSLKPI